MVPCLRRLILTAPQAPLLQCAGHAAKAGEAKGLVRGHGQWQRLPVNPVPFKRKLALSHGPTV